MPTEVVVFQERIDRLLRDVSMREALLDATRPGVHQAKLRAPKRTGAGAASIRAEAVLDGGMWTARISWDREHYYMSFHELGTVHLPRRPFLVPSIMRTV